MYVSVKFKDKWSGEFRGREYSYVCNIPGIAVGDVVIAPTARGDSEVQISAINVPGSSISPAIRAVHLSRSSQKSDAQQLY